MVNADRVLLLVSCLLSLVGGGAVIYRSFYPPKNRRRPGRRLLFWLSVTDVCTALTYGVPALFFGSPHKGTACEVQALIGMFFPISSFLWTDAIALYVYRVIVQRRIDVLVRDRETKGPFLWTHLVCWGVPALICIIVGSFGHAGYYSSGTNTGGWCWITAGSHEKLFLWELVGGKLVEWSSILVVFVLYFKTWSELHSLSNPFYAQRGHDGSLAPAPRCCGSVVCYTCMLHTRQLIMRDMFGIGNQQDDMVRLTNAASMSASTSHSRHLSSTLSPPRSHGHSDGSNGGSRRRDNNSSVDGVRLLSAPAPLPPVEPLADDERRSNQEQHQQERQQQQPQPQQQRAGLLQPLNPVSDFDADSAAQSLAGQSQGYSASSSSSSALMSAAVSASTLHGLNHIHMTSQEQEVADHMHEAEQQRRKGSISAFNARLMLVPIVFFIARLWGSIRVLMVATGRGDSVFLQHMQAFFDPSQGFFNGILFVLLSKNEEQSSRTSIAQESGADEPSNQDSGSSDGDYAGGQWATNEATHRGGPPVSSSASAASSSHTHGVYEQGDTQRDSTGAALSDLDTNARSDGGAVTTDYDEGDTDARWSYGSGALDSSFRASHNSTEGQRQTDSFDGNT